MTKINKIRSKKQDVMETAEIQGNIRDYYKQLYANIMDNLEEMDEFLKKYNLSRLSKEEIKTMNRSITNNEIETD